MEAIEEFTGSNDHTVVVKGKRTKRSRPLSPFGMAVTSSSSSGGGGGGGGGGDVCYSAPSPTTSGEFSTTTEEEEDMANCLILLAQGVGPRQVEKKAKIEKFSSSDHHPRLAMATATTGSTGIYVYECKTCNRTFPSFQALGGHRASHKKPKAMAAEEKKVMSMTPFDHDDHHSNMIEDGHFINISPPPSLQIVNKPSQHQQHMNNNKAKVHECSVCGTEFSSGQALGGHMRRHRTHTNTRLDTNSTIQSQEDEKPIRHVLSLDLNLPAPEDDHRDSKFQFASNQQHLVFSSPALVDCHY